MGKRIFKTGGVPSHLVERAGVCLSYCLLVPLLRGNYRGANGRKRFLLQSDGLNMPMACIVGLFHAVNVGYYVERSAWLKHRFLEFPGWTC